MVQKEQYILYGVTDYTEYNRSDNIEYMGKTLFVGKVRTE